MSERIESKNFFFIYSRKVETEYENTLSSKLNLAKKWEFSSLETGDGFAVADEEGFQHWDCLVVKYCSFM